MKTLYNYRNLVFILILLLSGATACLPRSEYEGYSRTRTGINYRLKAIGESGLKPVPGDYITVDLYYSTTADSLFFSGRRKFRLEEPSYRGSVEECFTMLNEGDEADFIIDASRFFNITLDSPLPRFMGLGDDIKITVRMIDIQSAESYTQEKQAFLKWVDNFAEHERFRLESFIRNEQIDVQPDSLGLYLIKMIEGEGKRVEKGDTIELHYEGRFVDGRFFDSTRKSNEIFQFVYGEEMQLFEALNRAVGMMREGEKSLVIVPSELAFGDQGSSTGIIPPFTSLVYELEILSVR